MKKIVALVLSLVMVLGLATTAFAYPAAEKQVGAGVMYYKTTTGDDAATAGEMVAMYETAATAPQDLDKTGVGAGTVEDDEAGNVKYFTMKDSVGAYVGGKYVQVATVGEADFVVYYAKLNAAGTAWEKTDSVFMYVAALDENPLYKGTAVLFNDFGEDCGQYDLTPVADTKYYVFQGEIFTPSAVGNATDASLMIDGKLTSVTRVGGLDGWVGHTAKFTYDKNYKITAVECAECGVAATIYPNYASVPKAEIKAANVYGPINTDDYYCWTKAPAAADVETDKVESAETFDAGIAMYVGMSVMAAAGSAVVLKKKD